MNNQMPSFMETTIKQNYSQLTRLEENTLIEMYKQGDRRALSRLINSQMKTIVAIAKKYSDKNSPIEDCIQEGVLAFPKAIMDFNPEMGMRFMTLLAPRIRAVIQVYAFQNDVVRLPMNKVKEIAKKPKNIEEEIIAKKPKRAEMVSMSAPINYQGETSTTIEDTLVDESVEDIEKVRNIGVELERYLSAFDKTSRNWKMFEMLHGLDGNGVKTMETVAKSFGCSKQLVGITCLKMMKTLKKAVAV